MTVGARAGSRAEGARTQYPRAATVHSLFAGWVERAPDAVAVTDGRRTLTYAELARTAALLRGGLELEPGARVALYARRGIDAIVGMLAILSAGGCYVPLDPADPPQRIRMMLDDADPVAVVAAEPVPGPLALPVLPLGAGPGLVAPAALAAVAADSPAYVMYTSGSTGAPKGVRVPHRAIVRLVVGTDFVHLGADEVALHLAPPTFDASTFEIWGSLLNGGRLVVLPDELPTVAAIRDAIRDHGVTTLWLPAALFRRVVEADARALAGVRQLVTGGDVVNAAAVRRVLAELPELTVVNGYGPTEATTFSCAYRMTSRTPIGSSLPIGRPIANTTVHVLGDDLRHVDIGAEGELCIGGDGVALGYVNRPSRTSEAFLRDPFAAEPDARLYRTGDRARMRSDGTVEFLGRRDRQVKLRGYRVELGEIDAALLSHPSVRDAACVLRRAANGENEIVGYVATDLEADQDDAKVVRDWRRLYDDVIYQHVGDPGARPVDPSFNAEGWQSSYTGRPIPEEELREQVEHTVARILEGGPERVLEIGCGTGLLAFRLLPHCRRYVGTDFSEIALDYTRGELERIETACDTYLVHAEAHDLAPVAGEQFDVVVLNSIVQHFPSARYLRTVLSDAAELVADGGRIFVGDLRSRALLPLFHASVGWRRLEPSTTVSQFLRIVEQLTTVERELVVDPEFFRTAGIPRVSAVRAMVKRGAYHNELTCFRYDIVLDVGGAPVVVQPDRELRVDVLDDVSPVLAEERPACLVIRDVANRRCALEAWLVRQPGGSRTLAELRDAYRVGVDGGIDPEELWALAAANGYRVEIAWSRGRADGSMDASFFLEAGAVTPESLPDDGAWDRHTNRPFAALRRAELAAELRAYLRARLPAHMIPSAVVALDTLPSTTAGKIDVAALPPPGHRAVRTPRGAAERDPTEAALAAVWVDVIGVDRIARDDSFFDLGGDSLDVIELVDRIEKRLGVRISPVAVFEQPTLAGLAGVLRGDGTSTRILDTSRNRGAEWRSRRSGGRRA